MDSCWLEDHTPKDVRAAQIGLGWKKRRTQSRVGRKKAKVGLEGAGGGVTKMKTLYEILKEPMMGGRCLSSPFRGVRPVAGRALTHPSGLKQAGGWFRHHEGLVSDLQHLDKSQMQQNVPAIPVPWEKGLEHPGG